MPLEAQPIPAARRGPRLPKLVRMVAAAAIAVMALLLVEAGTADAVGTQRAGVRLADEPTTGTARFNSAFTHGFVSVDGTNIHYVKGGSGPAVLLLHSWPETWWEWRNVMPGLAQNHTVIAVDLPGLGASSAPAGGYDKATTARRITPATSTTGRSRPMRWITRPTRLRSG